MNRFFRKSNPPTISQYFKKVNNSLQLINSQNIGQYFNDDPLWKDDLPNMDPHVACASKGIYPINIHNPFYRESERRRDAIIVHEAMHVVANRDDLRDIDIESSNQETCETEMDGILWCYSLKDVMRLGEFSESDRNAASYEWFYYQFAEGVEQ